METMLSVILFLGFSAGMRADDARAIVDKAIKAAGGEETLAKNKAMTWTERGMFYGMGEGRPYTGTYAVQWPNQFRMEIKDYLIIVLDGDKGWMKNVNGGDATELEGDMLAEQKESHYAGWVTSLTPVKSEGFELTSLGDSKVGDREVSGVKVSHKGHGDVNLFFDKSTGLLIKSSFRAKDLQQGGKEVTQEVFMSDYKDVDGMQVPMKVEIKRDGKKFVQAVNLDVKVLPQLDSATFAKPGAEK
jgi:hypothetical protein